ncbi:hypothetical protein ATANTOWER_016232 [Ataeniobius toweri]|uniref:Uncharacterized protein n=1 Tax=Ataeniobius toweri TaxID=208326 RepID=A0ABU7BIK2_9TELE|nr:hypothetical protein [Ataeniobius toweri]
MVIIFRVCEDLCPQITLGLLQEEDLFSIRGLRKRPRFQTSSQNVHKKLPRLMICWPSWAVTHLGLAGLFQLLLTDIPLKPDWTVHLRVLQSQKRSFY